MKISEWLKVDLPPIEFYETGLQNFDEICGGIAKNEITLITGGTGTGKSNVLFHLATALSKENKILYISLENNAQIEMTRYKKIFETNEYNLSMEECDFEYINAIFEDDDKSILNIIEENIALLPEYDIIFIDAMETTIDGSEDGNALYRNGNILMKKLKKALNQYIAEQKSIVISWQMNRDANVKKLEDFTLYSIASSMGIARYAAYIFGVIDINNVKYLKVLKARNGFNSLIRYINIQDDNGNINLNNTVTVTKEEAKNIINFLKGFTNEEK